ncbi:MAG: transposase [Deltaproteobacteria bacterium]|jgi:hypothetical protein|nr:transposase [Deltaproteobacteria bacterium]
MIADNPRSNALLLPAVIQKLGDDSRRKGIRKDVLNSWAEPFRTTILPALPIELVIKLFYSYNGRPDHDLITLAWLAVTQELFSLTDEGVIQSFEFNLLFQYALDVMSEDAASVIVHLRTYIIFRQKLIDGDLIDPIRESIAVHIADKAFAADHSKQRLNSVRTESNLKSLARLTLFTKTIEGFLRSLQKQASDNLAEIHESLVSTDVTETNSGCCCFVLVTLS